MAPLTYHNWDDIKKPVFSINDPTHGAQKVLEWAFREYGEQVLYACSMGAEGMVLLDLISRIQPDAHVLFLDTGLHFQETYEVLEQVRERFPQLRLESRQPALTVEEQAEKYGEALWKTAPDQCCRLRKLEPLTEALQGVEAWISGLRREQSPTRRWTQFLNKDEKFHTVKICPLIHWTWDEVWQYIRERDLPYHVLHDQGYPSIGCAPCTLPVADGEDFRAGRWANFAKTECGLHSK
ncbi:phosphoadenosine phosphosulfate reductase [Marinithermofilum abyssi]|uniref:Adenosine 5'-phosphosulfate reductase n=1 Tax=Marinithermofilum abyssi TaxID=1571185 RepID=A0A8J2YE33_9BACL|nr:phosphoadenylyl-sulfate reductase [Marinithermofilum abyssi]GGE17331.1 phosphoadenosine phosphosulfate reductase [Marinithermofilum abyssi]